jgi:tellurium resistance protein TerZ
MSITLAKRQTINLTKDNGQGLTSITMGLGWDVAKSKGFFGFSGSRSESIDLDASVVAYDANKRKVEHVYFGQLKAFQGAIQHNGDNLTGDGDGDDETIDVDLTRLPANVETLVFTVNSFRGQSFDKVENAFCRLVDRTNDKEIARIDLSAKGAHTGVIMAKVSRQGNGWSLQALAEVGSGRTFNDMLPQIATLI